MDFAILLQWSIKWPRNSGSRIQQILDKCMLDYQGRRNSFLNNVLDNKYQCVRDTKRGNSQVNKGLVNTVELALSTTARNESKRAFNTFLVSMSQIIRLFCYIISSLALSLSRIDPNEFG